MKSGRRPGHSRPTPASPAPPPSGDDAPISGLRRREDGATVVAARGGEGIGEAALAVRTRMFTARLAQTVHAYPT